MSAKPNKQIEVGDEVAYSAQYLRDTGQQSTVEDRGSWRGEVTGFMPAHAKPGEWRLAIVRWSHASWDPRTVNDKNLVVVGTRAMVAD